MTRLVELPVDRYRILVGVRYLNASAELFAGLKRQKGVNDFHFVVTLRSFIEYTRRGIWFLVWASDKEVLRAEKLTFSRSGSPGLATMDGMIRKALGLGPSSPLKSKVATINEPYINCLHALTHGNPISVRILGIGVTKIFPIDEMLLKAETEMGLFCVLVYRRMLDQDCPSIWESLAQVHDRPDDMRTNVMIAADQLKKAGLDEFFGLRAPHRQL